MRHGRSSSSTLRKTIEQISIPVWGSEIVFLRTELDDRSLTIQNIILYIMLCYINNNIIINNSNCSVWKSCKCETPSSSMLKIL